MKHADYVWNAMAFRVNLTLQGLTANEFRRALERELHRHGGGSTPTRAAIYHWRSNGSPPSGLNYRRAIAAVLHVPQKTLWEKR